MDNKVLVNNIKKLCQEHNTTVSQVEKDLFMSPGLISRWAKNIPTLDRIMDIASYFDVTLDSIIASSASSRKNDNTIDTLLSVLYEQSINFSIDWEIFDQRHPLDNVDSEITAQLTDSGNLDCFYCFVNNGYFFLTATQTSTDAPSLFLYVLACPTAFPELKCSDSEKLSELYHYLSKRFSRQLNLLKTDLFIENFIQNSQVSNDSNIEENRKIKILKSSSSAKVV